MYTGLKHDALAPSVVVELFILAANCRVLTAPQKETLHPLAVPPLPPPAPSNRQCTVALGLPLLEIACKWSHAIHGLLGVAFIQHNFSDVHPLLVFHSFLRLNNLPLYGSSTFRLSARPLMGVWVVGTGWPVLP